MVTINSYLNFNGNTGEAFNFYKSVFGGAFSSLQQFKDTPHGENMSAADKEKIMHVALPIGQGNILMGTDALESMGQKLSIGNNYYLSIGTDTEKEADKLFNALSSGGKVLMPLEKTFWGAYFGMVSDKFGVQWMINHDYNQKK